MDQGCGDGVTGILVLGGRGMLGRAVAKASREAGLEVFVAGSEVDVASYDAMRTIESETTPHVVVNCAGVTPDKMRRPAQMVRANALGPWVVASAFKGARIINISSDCVFDGSRLSPFAYTVEDRFDATDLYGRTKAMGECPEAINVRTSFIGFEHGLLRWLIDQPPGTAVDGWLNAMWSGGTVYDIAHEIVQLYGAPELSGVVHLSSNPIDKWSLVSWLNHNLRLDLTILPVEEPRVNRALKATRHFERNLDRLVEEYASLRVHTSRA